MKGEVLFTTTGILLFSSFSFNKALRLYLRRRVCGEVYS